MGAGGGHIIGTYTYRDVCVCASIYAVNAKMYN